MRRIVLALVTALLVALAVFSVTAGLTDPAGHAKGGFGWPSPSLI